MLVHVHSHPHSVQTFSHTHTCSHTHTYKCSRTSSRELMCFYMLIQCIDILAHSHAHPHTCSHTFSLAHTLTHLLTYSLIQHLECLGLGTLVNKTQHCSQEAITKGWRHPGSCPGAAMF